MGRSQRRGRCTRTASRATGAPPAHLLRASLWSGLLWAAACATGGPDGIVASAYAPRGAYTGRLTVGSQSFTGALSLRTTDDGRVGGSLRILAPLNIDGSVRGRVIDDLLRITITYTGADDCESRIEGILTVARGADAIDGPVTVHDCSGSIAGSMSFGR